MGACYPVTANIPAPAASNVWVTFTASGTLTMGNASFGNAAPQATTNCAFASGSSSCIGIDQFCSSPRAAGQLSIATSASGYQTSWANDNRQNNLSLAIEQSIAQLFIG